MSGLWEHQRTALAVFRDFLARHEVVAAALVSMPTGTGKSAVIASLASDPVVGASSGSYLVLAPWRTLATQLRADLDERVWTNLRMDRPSTLPPATAVRSAAWFVEQVSRDDAKAQVYVTTMAMAMEVYKHLNCDGERMESLFERFAAVVVDECHYEPAPTWSEAVRAMRRPTCLLTATPFRNDNRYFALDAHAQYRYSHAKAIADRVLRTPEFVRLPHSLTEVQFVASLRERLADLQVGDGERVIVRCGDRAAVESVTHALRTAGETAVGFHDTFQPSDAAGGLLKYVPKPDERPDARFWVHQHKLTEGFDDPTVAVVAVYHGFGSDRARVQQIGRALRNPERADEARAYILDSTSQMEDAWKRYERFDAGEAPRSMATDPAGVEALLAAQPESFYWDRLFRENFDLHQGDAWMHIRYRASASIRVPAGTPDIDALAEGVRHELLDQERRVLSIGQPDPGTRVLLYLTVENSPVLRTGAFVEMSLGYTVLHWDGQRLFVSGSSSGVPKSIRDVTEPIGASQLVGLLPEGTRVSDVSLANNDLSQFSLRSRSLSAFDLATIASEVGDTTFGYATAEGHLFVGEDQVTRYAGVRNARVTDRRPFEGYFSELRSWFKEVARSLDASTAPARAIGRYAIPVGKPEDPKPAHVLLDIDPGQFEGTDGRSPLVIDDFGGEVGADGKFTAELNGVPVAIDVTWDSTSSKFLLGSSESVPFRSKVGARSAFWQHINREQSIRVATNDGLVYTNGNFWSLAAHGRGASSGLLSVLTDFTPLRDVLAEKGPVGRSGWSQTTAFGLIERHLMPQALGPDATIICVDLGTEIADFVGFNDSKVVFAHAKSKSKATASAISASALHEVVSQGVKNLRYLTIGNTDTPPTGTLHGTWKGGEHGTGARVRQGKTSSNGLNNWRRIDRIVQTHGADRELWLVLGASLSKSALEKQLLRPKPTAVSIQAYALLNSAWTAAQQCGVRLRVFCSP